MNERISLGEEEFVALTSLREIVGGFVHEMAQPLNAIMIASQVIQMKLQRSLAPMEEKAYSIDRLGMITAQVQRANEILEGLRHFSRGSGPAFRGDLAALFKKVRDLMGQQFMSRGIELTLHEEGTSLPVKGEETILLGVVVHAMAVARDSVQLLEARHSAKGLSYSKTIKVSLSSLGDRSSARISWNRGDIPAEELPELAVHARLLAAGQVIASRGGEIEPGDASVSITFP
ncbi:MAG: hypothetical protein AB1646_08840 [Thermodesulfobacteriota bacterium]